MMTFDELTTMFQGQTLAQMVGLTGEDALRLTTKAYDLVQVGACDAACEIYEALATLNPHDADLWCALADVYERLDRPNEALVAWRTCLKVAPRHPLARQRLDRLSARHSGN